MFLLRVYQNPEHPQPSPFKFPINREERKTEFVQKIKNMTSKPTAVTVGSVMHSIFMMDGRTDNPNPHIRNFSDNLNYRPDLDLFIVNGATLLRLILKCSCEESRLFRFICRSALKGDCDFSFQS
jgi:hypothetical protein